MTPLSCQFVSSLNRGTKNLQLFQQQKHNLTFTNQKWFSQRGFGSAIMTTARKNCGSAVDITCKYVGSSFNDFLPFKLNPGYLRYFGALSLSNQWCKKPDQLFPDGFMYFLCNCSALYELSQNTTWSDFLALAREFQGNGSNGKRKSAASWIVLD